GAGGLRLQEALLGHALVAFFLFLPELGAARAATERGVAVPRHLAQVRATRGQHAARGVVDAVVTPQVARVVVRDRPVEREGRKAALAREVLDQLGVVHHLVAAAQLR